MNQTIILLFSIILGAAGQVLLKTGVNELGSIELKWPDTIHTVFNIFTNGWVIAGIACFILSMILWVKILSGMELSRAYPSVSLSYPIVFLISLIFFNETASFSKLAGLLLVTAGVYLLNI